jgi:hypothetical protein
MQTLDREQLARHRADKVAQVSGDERGARVTDSANR